MEEIKNDCFGQMPYREASEYDYATDPHYYTRADIVAKMISELNEIIPQLKEKQSGNNQLTVHAGGVSCGLFKLNK